MLRWALKKGGLRIRGQKDLLNAEFQPKLKPIGRQDGRPPQKNK